MDEQIPTVEEALQLVRPWPSPCPLPPLPPLDRFDTVHLRAGEEDADAVELDAALSARRRGALDVAVAEGLAAISKGDRLIQLGFSCLGDYGREVLGIQERTTQNLVHLARGLRDRPLLRAAVMAGEVRVRSAETVLRVAKGEAEDSWVELARRETVRSLEKLVRKALATGIDEEDDWTRLRTGIDPEDRPIVEEGLSLARKVLGHGSTRAQQLEAMAQEYLGGYPEVAGDDDEERLSRSFRPVSDRMEKRKEQLENETYRWEHLPEVAAFLVPEWILDDSASAKEIDAEIRRLAEMRASWDDMLGYSAQAVKASRLPEILGFASFAQFCEERLGLAARTVQQRVAVERRLWQLPELRDAWARRHLSYEQVRLLTRLPDSKIAEWIPRAQGMTCIQLRRAIQAEEEAQMRAARILVADVPVSTARLLTSAIRAVRAVESSQWSDGKCLVALASHFVSVWKPLVKKARTRSQKVRERDLGFCTVPMCSRVAAHSHHVEFRGRGGSNEEDNQTGICAVHHLRGVHGGYLRVTGTAPNGLVWELGGEVWMGPQRWMAPGWRA